MTSVTKITRKNGAVVKVELMRFLSLTDARCVARGASYDQLPWCPSEFKPLYRRLRQKGFSAAEARPMVEETISTRSANVLVSAQVEKAHRI